MDKRTLYAVLLGMVPVFLGGCASAPSCTPIPGDLNGNNVNEEYLIALLAAVILYGLWKLFRNRRR